MNQKACLLLLVFVLPTCQPNGWRQPACPLPPVLPQFVPAGAVDCGEAQLDLLPDFTINPRFFDCANAAIARRSPFVQRLLNPVGPNPMCSGSGFCPPLLGVTAAYVGSLVDGRFRLTIYFEGQVVLPPDSTQDAGADAGQGSPLTLVRRECFPANGATLRQTSPQYPIISIQCDVGGSDLVEFVTMPMIASCPHP
jgi:hypothetical protein